MPEAIAAASDHAENRDLNEKQFQKKRRTKSERQAAGPTPISQPPQELIAPKLRLAIFSPARRKQRENSPTSLA